MQNIPNVTFPEGSLLAAMLGRQAPVEARRAAQRLRAEGAPVVAVDDEIAALARGLATSEVSRSPAVLDVLPPLFWLEATPADAPATGGWVVEKKRGGLAIRAFRIVPGQDAIPEPDGTLTLDFGPATPEEDTATRFLRGLVTAISLPGLLSQMGESSPVALLPADASGPDAGSLRGLRLSVAMAPEAAPN